MPLNPLAQSRSLQHARVMANSAKHAFECPSNEGAARVIVALGAITGVQGVKEVVVADVKLIWVDSDNGAVLFVHALDFVGKSVARLAENIDQLAYAALHPVKTESFVLGNFARDGV